MLRAGRALQAALPSSFTGENQLETGFLRWRRAAHLLHAGQRAAKARRRQAAASLVALCRVCALLGCARALWRWQWIVRSSSAPRDAWEVLHSPVESSRMGVRARGPGAKQLV